MAERIPYNIFGYTFQKTSGRTIPSKNREQEEVIKKIFKVFTEERLSFNQIAERIHADTSLDRNAIKPLTRVHIARILSRPEYAGLYRDEKGIIHASEVFPSIVNFKVWANAQMLLARRSFENREANTRIKYPFSGVLKCSICGAYYYHHGTQYYAHKYDTSNDPCPNSNHYIRKKALDDYVIAILFDLATDELSSGELLRCIKSYNNKVLRHFPHTGELTARITDLSNEIDRLPVSDTNRDRMIVVLDSLQNLEAMTPSNDSSDINSIADDIRYQILHLSISGPLKRLELIDKFVDGIVISDKSVVITLSDGHKRKVTLENMEKRTQQLMKQSIDNRYSPIRDTNAYFSSKAEIQLSQEEISDDEYRRELYSIKKVHVQIGKSAPFKAYLPQGVMVSSKNQNHILYLDDVYQWNLEGDYLIDLAGVARNTTLYNNGYHIAIVVLGEIFINQAWIHTAPATIKAGALEYFAYDGNSIILARDRNRIRAYNYSGFRRRQEIPILDALTALISAHDIRFIDL